VSRRARPIDVAQPSSAALAFNGTALVLYELDGLLWLAKDQLEALLGCELPKHARYYSRHFSDWNMRIVITPDGRQDRVFTLDGAADLARKAATPQAVAFVAWVESIRTSAPPGAFLHTEPEPVPGAAERALARRLLAATRR